MYHTLTVIGNLGRDPQTHTTPNGANVTTFSVATTRKFRRSDGSDGKETTWFTVEVWGKMGEHCQRYLRKGRQVHVVGRLVPDPATGGPRVYRKKNGDYGAAFVVRATTITFLGSWNNNGDDEGYTAEDDDFNALEEVDDVSEPVGTDAPPF